MYNFSKDCVVCVLASERYLKQIIFMKIKFEDLKEVNNKLNINFKDFFNSFLNSGNYILGESLKIKSHLHNIIQLIVGLWIDMAIVLALKAYNCQKF